MDYTEVRKSLRHTDVIYFLLCYFHTWKKCKEIIKCVLHLTWWIIEVVAEMSALFIELTTEKHAICAHPPTVKSSRWCCHLSPCSLERRDNKNYISGTMWLLLRLVCLSLRGRNSSKHRLLNGEWTFAILAVPTNPVGRQKSAVMPFNTVFHKLLYKIVIGAFEQSHDTKQDVMVCVNTGH